MKTLRPYQAAGEVSLFKYLFEQKGNPLVVAPVAAGKSLMIASFIKKLHEYFPRVRVVKLTHVKELLQQNAEELFEQYPSVDMGFYCAGLNEKKLHNDVTFASIQSVHNKLANFNRLPEIIVIDEAHLISHKDSTTYRKFIDACMHHNPNCRVIGFTGTPYRADTGRLDEGENKLFDHICYEIGMDYMIEQGYWAKPVCPEIATKMDVSGVATSGGDYVEKQLQAAVNKEEITDACVEELAIVGKGRKKWLIFTAGIEHAENVCDMLNMSGISARFVHSKQCSKINDQNLKDHRAGKFTALVNIAKLTTGYNDPEIDLIVFMRPTRSPVLYVQMIGRGVRVVYADGYDLSVQQGRLDAIANSIKPDCMVVDFGGVVSTLGPIDQINIRKKHVEKEEGEGGEAIMKICPSCGTECSAAQRYCLSCGYCFIKLDQQASNKAVVSMDEEPEWVDVLAMNQLFHITSNSWEPSMKVTYTTMIGAIREWVCFRHWNFEVGDKKRYAWDKAVSWHNARLPGTKVPKEIEDAIEIKYPKPSKILVKKKGKFFEIIDYEWSKEEPDPFVDVESEEEFVALSEDHPDYQECPF